MYGSYRACCWDHPSGKNLPFIAKTLNQLTAFSCIAFRICLSFGAKAKLFSISPSQWLSTAEVQGLAISAQHRACLMATFTQSSALGWVGKTLADLHVNLQAVPARSCFSPTLSFISFTPNKPTALPVPLPCRLCRGVNWHNMLSLWATASVNPDQQDFHELLDRKRSWIFQMAQKSATIDISHNQPNMLEV